MFPVMVIGVSEVEHNVDTLRRFCLDTGVSLAPHGKTTMSPELAHRQLDAGSWAITASTASQARIYRAFGVSRILIAHQVVGPAAVRWAWDSLQEDPRFELLCLADSVDGVRRMDEAVRERPPGRPIDVLIELGMTSGRTGCRTIEEAVEVAREVAESERLRLVGVEGYEGILHYEAGDFTKVDAFLGGVRALAGRLGADGLFDGLDEVVVTAGGSMFPDRVVAMLGDGWDLGRPVRLVIRPGGYVTHDAVLYAESGPFGKREPMAGYPPLQPALRLWSYVVSRPEPDLALLGFGKRDVSFDIDLPVPELARRNGTIEDVPDGLEIFELNDQHAFLHLPADFAMSVGDIIGCGISHPCATFDRWRALPLVDDDHNVVGAVRTFF